jgi:hypothetical protein
MTSLDDVFAKLMKDNPRASKATIREAYLNLVGGDPDLSLALANFEQAHRLRGTRNIGSFSTIS